MRWKTSICVPASLCCCYLQLTRLLEDSLGGSSKTLLVVNCRCGRVLSLTFPIRGIGSVPQAACRPERLRHAHTRATDSHLLLLLLLSCSPAAENVAETKCSLDFATRARKVELGQAVRVADLSSGGGTSSSPTSTSGGGRDSPINGSPSRPSQLCSSSGASAGGGSGSANSSPRVSGRYTGSGGANELRQAAVTRRAAASTSQKEDKWEQMQQQVN